MNQEALTGFSVSPVNNWGYFSIPYLTRVSKPTRLCLLCFYKLGFGYDRISKRFGLNKKMVSGFLSRIKRKQGDVSGRTNLPLKPSIHKAINKQNKDLEKEFNREARLQKTLEKKRLSKLKIYLRTKIWRWIFKNEHRFSAAELAGCSKPHFIAHIESLFKRGMSWDNYGEVWEFDHVIPCSQFNLYSDLDRKKCFHFTNYQPKSVSENRKKSARIIPCQPELLIQFHTIGFTAHRQIKPFVTKQDERIDSVYALPSPSKRPLPATQRAPDSATHGLNMQGLAPALCNANPAP